MRITLSILLALLAATAAPHARADYFIVVNEKNPVQQLSHKEALHLFMGRSRQFPGGGAAVAYDMPDMPQREGFYRALGGMSLSQVTSYWARLMFSGRSLPPQRLEHAAAMAEQVGRDPLAIGWLPEPPKQKGVRTVLVLKSEP